MLEVHDLSVAINAVQILRGVDFPLPLLDTTRIHVDAVLRAAM